MKWKACWEPRARVQAWPNATNTVDNQSQRWHRNGIEKPSHKDMNLGRADPMFLRNMHFSQKHNKKDLKKTQANNTKARSPQGGQAQDPKGWQPQAQLACIAHPKLGKSARCRIAQGLRALESEVQDQGLNKTQTTAVTPAAAPAAAQAPKGAQAPLHKGSSAEAPVCQCEDRRPGVTHGLLSAWGWCPPALFVQINMRQDLSKKKNEMKNSWQ
uniref:Large ribosomal subunit protein eL29 n=1 Tax=Canis lupus familiaris TaxID=9615 RepID=A0A8C0MVJ0_CANLF